MDSLPHDILVHICRFLSLKSRNQIRLVNKRLNDACNNPFIMKMEFFRISRSIHWINLADIFSLLIKSRRTIINLKFDYLVRCSKKESINLFLDDNNSRDFWLSHGAKVRYLEFSLCIIEVQDLIMILKCCSNLNEFNYSWPRKHKFIDVLEIMSDDDVILKNVTSLTLRHCHQEKHYQKEALSCKVFPNLRNLNIEVNPALMSSGTKNEFVDLCREILDYISISSPKLQAVELEFSRCMYWFLLKNESLNLSLTNVLAAAKQLKTLRLIELPFIHRHNILQLRNLSHLTNLSLNATETGLTMCEFIPEILDSVPKLRHLEVSGASGASPFGQINDNFVKKLVTSSLLSLRIILPLYREESNVPDKYICTHNDILETLIIENVRFDLDDRIFFFFFRCFRKLKNLSISPEISSNVMEAILVHQVNLKSLSVTNAASKSSVVNMLEYDLVEDAAPQLFSFRQFQYLEDLQLSIHSWFFPKQYCFTDFVLPQLKYLDIHFFDSHKQGQDPMDLEDFLRAIEECRLLEKLILCHSFPCIAFDSVVRQCESHRNLRELALISGENRRSDENYHPETYENVSSLFTICKSLQYVELDGLSLRRNFITNQIEITTD